MGIPSYALGLVFILVVSIIWSAASILVQYLYTDQSFDSPFLLTYIGTSLFILLIPNHWFFQQWRKRSRNGNADVDDYESIHSLTATAITTMIHDHHHHHHKWSYNDHIRAAAKIAPVWFISNYAYNASLKYTSITSSTVLASTGSLFTFLFALILRDEHFSMWKFFGVALGMSGSILTALHDASSSSSGGTTNDNDDDDDDIQKYRLWGDALGLLSAVGYGAYAIMVRVLCPRDESLMSMQLFLGFVGFWNMIVLSPIALYQVATHTTTLTVVVFGFVIVKGLLDNVLSDYLWARAVVLTSATVATVGVGLTIPLAFVSDVVLGRPNVLDLSSIGGALSVLVGFVLVNVGQRQEDQSSSSSSISIGDDDDDEQEDGGEEEQQQLAMAAVDGEDAPSSQDDRSLEKIQGRLQNHMSMEYTDAESSSFSHEIT
jgi:solute carrier family 35 protein F5